MSVAKKLLSLLMLAIMAAWAGSAAASVPSMQLGELVDGSEAVVHGRVLAMESQWDEGHKGIYTKVTVQPIDYMKGDLGQSPIQFEVPGGVVGEVGLAVSDVPEFEVGEEVILFLRSEYFRIVGWRQGKLTVRDGVILENSMKLDEFRAHIAGLTGVSGDAGETRGEDGAVIRRATHVAPFPIGEADRALPESGGPGPQRTPNAEVVLMTQDFEGSFPTGDWLMADGGGTGHEWGKETYRKHAGVYSMWECADGASALPSGSDYANNMQTWARYGPFDLSDATSAELRFWRSVQTASSNDYLFYGGSADGNNFSGYAASGGTGTWSYTTLNLATWLGDATVYIAFMFESNASGTNKGVFIDDIELVKTVPDVDSPVIDSITPNTGASGADVSVTIAGSNFGATQGTSEVQFVRDPLGTPTIDADEITSWSDTQIICKVPERASSGMVNVVVAGNPGVGKQFTVTYAASSTWWQTSEPMGENMLVNPNCADEPSEATLGAVIGGMQEWNAAGGAAFSFSYGGATGATDESYNSMNEICWGTTGGSLATNYTWYLPSTGEILENDIVFDDVWAWTTSGEPGQYDIQAVMTHELGHCLRLLDLYGTADAGKTMYGYINAGQTGARTLETADKDGIQYFYGAESVNITSRSLPYAQLAVPYSEPVAASGGTGPYTFSFRAGPSMPPGLTVGADGAISGTPTAEGMCYFNVRVTDAGLDKDSQVLPLEVIAGEPNCDVSPTDLDFGSLALGESANLSFTITNTGEVQLAGTVTEVCDHFSLVSGGGAYSIAPGGSRIVTMKYQPMAEGTHICTVETGNGLCSDVSCVGVAGGPNCDVSPTELDFGSLGLGESANLSFTITNTGGAPLTGTVAETCDHFSIVSGAGAYSIPAGAHRIVTVKYQPMAEGTHVCMIETGNGLCSDVSCVGVGTGGLPNAQGKWALHYAGAHNSKTNTCSFDVVTCTDIAVDAPSGLGRYDVYVVAVDVDRIAGTRYGLACDGPFYFYGWTKCSDLEIPTAGWPGCGEDNAQTWYAEKAGPHVTVGILDVYVYGSSTSLSVGPDSRVGFAEWCDQTQPSPLCYRPTSPKVFGEIGFGVPGYNPCSVVPVILAGFNAKASEDGILLEWSSSTDVSDLSHFFVHRSAIGRDGEYLKLHDDPVEEVGVGGGDYSYLDAGVIPGTYYYYKLEGVERGGKSTFFGPYGVKAYEGRAEYRLSQNVPNPFSRGSTTTIQYSVAEAGAVKIRILDAAGRLVRTITESARSGGNQVRWDGTDGSGRRVPSGVYFYEIQAGGFSAERKMLVVD